jgi:glycosyltransferase involved in cell wall biosynthesis
MLGVNMKITLLHPSRGRGYKAYDTYKYWKDQASGNIEIEHILSIDNDDPDKSLYMAIFKGSKIIAGDNGDVVQATNRAAKYSSGDILVYLSDDFKCPKDWDLGIVYAVQECHKLAPLLLKVDDCLQKFNIPVLTIPIMNRALYEKLGYFWNPLYKSMFVDEDLYWVCRNNGWILEAPELKFPHEHCSNGKAENDETYKRSSANWNQGKVVFAKRKSEGFPI